MNYKSTLTGLKLLREIQWNNFIFRCSISICAYYEGARTGKRVSEFSNDSSLVPSNDEYNKHGRAVVCGPVWRGAIANQSFSRSYYYVFTATPPRVYIVRETTYFTESNPSPKLLVAESTTRSSYCFTDGTRGLINVSRATTRRTTSIIYMILRVLARGSTANISPNARCELSFKSRGYDIMRSPRYSCAHKRGVLLYGESVCFDWRLITKDRNAQECPSTGSRRRYAVEQLYSEVRSNENFLRTGVLYFLVLLHFITFQSGTYYYSSQNIVSAHVSAVFTAISWLLDSVKQSWLGIGNRWP